MDMRSTPTAGTINANAAYERRVAVIDVKIREGSSGESWIQVPQSDIWTMVGQNMAEGRS